MTLKPRLADVKCSKIDFRPGDRVLVQVYDRLDTEDRRRLEKTVQKWAGPYVEIFIVDRTRMELHIERA
jgi:hypothetical protein